MQFYVLCSLIRDGLPLGSGRFEYNFQVDHLHIHFSDWHPNNLLWNCTHMRRPNTVPGSPVFPPAVNTRWPNWPKLHQMPGATYHHYAQIESGNRSRCQVMAIQIEGLKQGQILSAGIIVWVKTIIQMMSGLNLSPLYQREHFRVTRFHQQIWALQKQFTLKISRGISLSWGLITQWFTYSPRGSLLSDPDWQGEAWLVQLGNAETRFYGNMWFTYYTPLFLKANTNGQRSVHNEANSRGISHMQIIINLPSGQAEPSGKGRFSESLFFKTSGACQVFFYYNHFTS